MLIIVYRSTLQKKGMPGKDEIPLWIVMDSQELTGGNAVR